MLFRSTIIGRALAALLPNFRFVEEHGLMEGMAQYDRGADGKNEIIAREPAAVEPLAPVFVRPVSARSIG